MQDLGSCTSDPALKCSIVAHLRLMGSMKEPQSSGGLPVNCTAGSEFQKASGSFKKGPFPVRAPDQDRGWHGSEPCLGVCLSGWRPDTGGASARLMRRAKACKKATVSRDFSVLEFSFADAHCHRFLKRITLLQFPLFHPFYGCKEQGQEP